MSSGPWEKENPWDNSVRRVSDVLVTCSVAWQEQVLSHGLGKVNITLCAQHRQVYHRECTFGLAVQLRGP